MAVRAAAMLKDGTARSDPRRKKDGQPAGAFVPLQEKFPVPQKFLMPRNLPS